MFDQKSFVAILKEVVMHSSVRDTIKNLENPPGRNPPIDWLILCEFYRSLDERQKILFSKILSEVSETTLFGVLCVLDGVRAVEDDPDKGYFELLYRKGDKAILLNDPEEDFLHDFI